jgi:molecular chaperone HscB
MQNHFALFQLPLQFSIDMDSLNAAYREVQNRVHPDKFANATDAEKRVAMQWATLANEAYQTLKNPLKRAMYFCQLHGVDLQIETNTAMPRDFLIQQMEWRDTLDEAINNENVHALEKLDAEFKGTRQLELDQIGGMLDDNNFVAVAQGIRRLMFLEKFGDEIDAALQSCD